MSLQEQANEHKLPAKTGHWQKGKSGNPLGRPKHARERFTKAFMDDLAVTWQKQGKPALDHLAKIDPATFVRVCASLMPKEVRLDASGPLADLSEEELQALTAAAQRAVAKANLEEGLTKQLEHDCTES